MFFSIALYENKNQKGRTDVKISSNCTLIHIVLAKMHKNTKYNVDFFVGENGQDGLKKGYIVTDRFGNFNNTIRFLPNEYSMEDFKKLSLVLIYENETPANSCNIVGFRGPKYDYKEALLCKNSNSINEYKKNEKYDELIDSIQDYWPFLTKVEDIKTVKLDLKQFNSLNLNCIKDSMNQYIVNSLKFYGFIIFGRCTRGDKFIYMIGIPDKYNPSQVISMANMGSNKFYGIDLTRKPQTGDMGFWSIYI